MKKLLILLFVVVGFGLNAQELNTWTTQEYADEFGDPTGNHANVIVCEGTFSNTATNESLLWAKVIYNGDDVRMQLFEYGKIKARSHEYARIKIKNDKGVKKVGGYNIKDGNIWISSRKKKKLLLNGGKIAITIGSSKYNFKLPKYVKD